MHLRPFLSAELPKVSAWLVAAVLLLCPLQRAFSVEVTLLFWSDRHAHNLPETRLIDDEYVNIGGAAELAGVVNLLRAGVPRTLVLVAGDEFTGTPVSSRTAGLSEIKVLNSIGIDAFVPGNHEFDFGWRSLLDVTDDAQFSCLLANVTQIEDSTRLFASDTLFDLDGVKVGVIGVIYEDFVNSVVRDGIIGLEVHSPVEAVKDFVSRRRKSCDLLVALTHLGLRRDSLLAASVDGLDVIIGGHSHTPTEVPLEVNGVIIMQANPESRGVGRLVVDVDAAANRVRRFDGELLPVRPEVAPPDRKVAKLIRKLEKKYTKGLDRLIGTLRTDWRLDRLGPSNLAQWCADAMLGQIRGRVSDRINMSVINAGNLRKELERGPVTERDIWEICPFENPVLVFQLSGEELLGVIRFLMRTPREFMTWSGLQVEAQDDKILSVKINGNPLDRHKEYTVLTTGYLFEHIDSYLGLQQLDRPMFFVPGVNQRELLVDTVIRQKVITSPLDNRWDVR